MRSAFIPDRILFVSRGLRDGVLGRVRLAPWRDGDVGRSVLSGPGGDLTEEPASRDVEPVTLAAESFPIVLPGPSAPGAARVGEELSVDGVAHVPLQDAERFFLCFAFGDSAVESRRGLRSAVGGSGRSRPCGWHD